MRIYHSAVVDEYRVRDRLLHLAHGHELELVSPPAWSEGGSMVEPGPESTVPMHIVSVAGRAHPNLFWYREQPIRRILRRLRPEIVDIHEEPFSLAAAGLLRCVRIEAPNAAVCLYTAQNLDRRYPPPFSHLERRALRVAGAAYPCSTEAGERLRRRGFTGALHVLPLGVTIERPPRTIVKVRRVGFIGRLEPYKGADLAVRAFLQAAAGSDCMMEVIGGGSQASELEALVAAAGAQAQVRLTGVLSQPETLERVAQMDVVLIPSLTTRSWKEQFGRVAVQAMAAGAVVIASDSGSLREVVSDAGVLSPEGDVNALAHHLRRLIDDPGLASQLAEAGFQRATARFTWEAVAAGHDAMYRSLR